MLLFLLAGKTPTDSPTPATDDTGGDTEESLDCTALAPLPVTVDSEGFIYVAEHDAGALWRDAGR